MTMYCPLCDGELKPEAHFEADGDVPAHWLCLACDCRINSFDDEYELPELAKDAPQTAG